MSTFTRKSRKRSSQAIRWLEKHEQGQSTKGFGKWATRDTENMDEFLGVAAESELLASSPVLNQFDTELAVEQARAYVRAERVRFWRNVGVSTTVGAGLVAALVLGLAPLFQHPEPKDPPSVNTWQQAAREVPLSDGSLLDLSTNSAVLVQMTDTVRRVELQAGEVLFKVAKDRSHRPPRPFLVDIPLARIEVTGTSFSVQRGESETQIHVLEGRVQVFATRFRQEPITANPGDDVVVRTNGEVVVTTAAARTAPATIKSRTLAEIVAAFNKANPRPEFVVQGAARDKMIGLSIKEDEPRKLIEILEREPSLRVRRVGDRVVISMRD